MPLDILPFRTASAAENMAMDFLLLRRYPQPHARFRHYEWHRPSFTFGYSQKIAFVCEQLAGQADESLDLCRRPTGGGIVDHREDWTYSLIIPRGHPLEEARATESYREIHITLTAALQKQGVAAEVKPECEPPEDGQTCGPSGVCFQRAERYDVVHSRSGEKIAGGCAETKQEWTPFSGLTLAARRANRDRLGYAGRRLHQRAHEVTRIRSELHPMAGIFRRRSRRADRTILLDGVARVSVI